MVYIIVTGRGCRTPMNSDIHFRCSMCRPWQAKLDNRVVDNARACALSRISKGVVYQYHEPIIEKDKTTKKDKIVGYNLVEKFRDDYQKV